MQWVLFTACFLKRACFFPYVVAFIFLAYMNSLSIGWQFQQNIVVHLASWNIPFEKEGFASSA